MKNSLTHYLVPGFLRKLDHYLLLNYRLLWISKIHYVAFYTLLITILLWIVASLVQPGYTSLSSPVGMLLNMSLLPFVAWWTWQQIQYNPVKYFREKQRRMELAQIVIYMLCSGLFAWIPIWGSCCFTYFYIGHFEFYLRVVIEFVWIMLIVFPTLLLSYQHIGLKRLVFACITGFISACLFLILFGLLIKFISVKSVLSFVIPFVILILCLGLCGCMVWWSLHNDNGKNALGSTGLYIKTLGIAVSQVFLFLLIFTLVALCMESYGTYGVDYPHRLPPSVSRLLYLLTGIAYQFLNAWLFMPVYTRYQSIPRI